MCLLSLDFSYSLLTRVKPFRISLNFLELSLLEVALPTLLEEELGGLGTVGDEGRDADIALREYGLTYSVLGGAVPGR